MSLNNVTGCISARLFILNVRTVGSKNLREKIITQNEIRQAVV